MESGRRVADNAYANFNPAIPHPVLAPEFTNKPVMGYRETIKIHKEEKEITKMVEGKEKKGVYMLARRG